MPASVPVNHCAASGKQYSPRRPPSPLRPLATVAAAAALAAPRLLNEKVWLHIQVQDKHKNLGGSTVAYTYRYTNSGQQIGVRTVCVFPPALLLAAAAFAGCSVFTSQRIRFHCIPRLLMLYLISHGTIGLNPVSERTQSEPWPAFPPRPPVTGVHLRMLLASASLATSNAARFWKRLHPVVFPEGQFALPQRPRPEYQRSLQSLTGAPPSCSWPSRGHGDLREQSTAVHGCASGLLRFTVRRGERAVTHAACCCHAVMLSHGIKKQPARGLPPPPQMPTSIPLRSHATGCGVPSQQMYHGMPTVDGGMVFSPVIGRPLRRERQDLLRPTGSSCCQ